MKLLILGNGSSGRAAAALAARLGHETLTLEGDDAFPAHFTEMRPRGDAPQRTGDPADPAHFTEMRPRGDAFGGAIVSPGIPLDHPWQVACRAAGIPVKSELQFGCEELRRQGVRLLAVTGSKGKSSVVKLVADALVRAGHRAVPCGNYGRPVCDVALTFLSQTDQTSAVGLHPSPSPSRWAVVEVSSFQLETTELAADTFEAAAILNLQEDHLDRHGSVAAYHALKLKLLGFAKEDVSVVDAVAHRVQAGAPVVDAEALRVKGGEADLLAGSYFDNEVLRTNGACAVRLLRAAGLGDAAIRAAFVAFEPLPHRMNTVGVFGGITCVDDSKATSLAALAAGVRMVSPSLRVSRLASESSRLGTPVSGPPPRPFVRLIAGGLPKGDDPKTVRSVLTERVKKVYLIGTSAEQFAAAWSGVVDCEICGTMDRAVRAAMREAESGETVLLSPGTASFDQFHSFGERGDVFADLVKKEGKNK